MRRLVWLGVLVASVRLGCGACIDDGRASYRLGTYNIRFFPEESTDRPAVAARIAELDADAFAVQEIIDPDALAAAVAEASRATGRDYALTLGTYCSNKRTWWLGVVYDRRRLTLRDARSFSDRARCASGHPSAHAAIFDDFALVAVHLKAGAEAGEHARRKRQWMHAVASQRGLERELARPVVLAGDFNTTGFRDDAAGERSYIRAVTRSAGLTLATDELPCSAYWRPPGGGYAPSTLDHVIGRGGEFEGAEVLGYCRELDCAPVAERPRDHHRVSDHCPVAVDFRP